MVLSKEMEENMDSPVADSAPGSALANELMTGINQSTSSTSILPSPSNAIVECSECFVEGGISNKLHGKYKTSCSIALLLYLSLFFYF